ncbi:MAG: DUF1295 domain-containing protein, partial [Anaerolineae bacterium]|nr:DUF1295 domain-containing protein [Anaerolineae bacterium]
MNQTIKSILAILVVIAIGVGVAVAGSQNGTTLFGDFPLYAFAVVLAFSINWIVFIPAYLLQSEKFFDLTGSLTYISVSAVSLLLAPERDLRSYLLAGLVVIWAVRLGSFLFKRVLKAGKDGRFDDLKPNFLRFLSVWTLQGLWVTFTASAALIAITTSVKKPIDAFAVIGFLVWLIGIGIEAAADTQKSRWRAKPENKGKFINVGLWSKSRHPNYFGEIVLWVGITIIALPVLLGWQFVALISPIFVTILLTRISGVPMLEKRADEKWGGQA